MLARSAVRCTRARDGTPPTFMATQLYASEEVLLIQARMVFEQGLFQRQPLFPLGVIQRLF
jgi:hypothetical protein